MCCNGKQNSDVTDVIKREAICNCQVRTEAWMKERILYLTVNLSVKFLQRRKNRENGLHSE